MLDNAIFYTGEKPVKLKKWNQVENRISVSDQAKIYAEWILENEKRDLWFFPLMKTHAAHSNHFRFAVFNCLLGHGPDYLPYGYLESTWIYENTSKLEKAGYTINIYRPE